MMTPVPLKNIQAFQDEGYARDLLFLMFLANVQVSEDLIDPIDAAVAARCGRWSRRRKTWLVAFPLSASFAAISPPGPTGISSIPRERSLRPIPFRCVPASGPAAR